MKSQSRVFAALPAAEFTEMKENQQGLEPRAVTGQVREVQVTGAAEASCPADRASMRFNVTSSKESAGEATVSVTRRLDYILQALRHIGGPYSVDGLDSTDKGHFFYAQHLQLTLNNMGSEVRTRQFLQRNADTYCMDAEVVVMFSNFEKMEQIRSVLLEKLDKSVFVGTPQFYHSPECLGQIRQRACVSAVENAQQKASEISQLLGQSLGPPLLVREKETREWKVVVEEEEQRSAPHIPVVTVSSCVSVSFSFRDRSRKKL